MRLTNNNITNNTTSRNKNIKRNNHRYSSAQYKKKKFTNRISRPLITKNIDPTNINCNRISSRSSSLHSLVQVTTFLNKSKPVWKMIATSVSPNNSQFAHSNHSNANKSFNSFKNNRNFNKNVNKNANKNVSRQVVPNLSYQKQKSQPIQMNRSNFGNSAQPQQQAYFNQQNHQSGSFNSSFGFNAATSLANMFQNSELTVNLTNNEPRLVIFNNNISNNNNAMSLFNASLNHANANLRETNKFFNNNSQKPFHHSKQQQQNRQQTPSESIAINCNLNKNTLSYPFESYNYKTKTIASLNTGYKHNTALAVNTNNHGQRYPNRFKYVKPTNITHSATKNSAPYNTTQYIMFDYSRRRTHDQECPTEQNSFTDEWNMALAANSDQSKEATNSTSSTRSINTIPINNDSIIKVNYNEFSLNTSYIAGDGLTQVLSQQFSLSEQNLEKMDQEENITGEEEESMMQENQSHDRMPQLSSSL